MVRGGNPEFEAKCAAKGCGRVFWRRRTDPRKCPECLKKFGPKMHRAYRRPIRPCVTRKAVLERDNYRCFYCGGLFAAADLELDHVVPREAGGAHSVENRITACRWCNGKKSSQILGQFAQPTLDEIARRNAKMGWAAGTRIQYGRGP